RDATRMEEAWQKRRFSVKPGLTCLWQVSGRSNLSFEQWMQLDLDYIDRWSLKLDASILLRTIPAIVLARGASWSHHFKVSSKPVIARSAKLIFLTDITIMAATMI